MTATRWACRLATVAFLCSTFFTPTRTLADTVTWSGAAALNKTANIDPANDYAPSLATDGKGNWVAVWHSFNEQGGQIRLAPHILYARSIDNGVTWSFPQPIIANDLEDLLAQDYQPEIATDGQGTYVAVWMSYNVNGESNEADIVFSKSVNSGATWSEPAPIHSNHAFDQGQDEFPRIATDKKGTWVVTWSSNNLTNNRTGQDDEIWLVRSVNNGSSWTPGRPINSDYSSDNFHDTSVDVATDGDGNWIAVWNKLAKPASTSDDSDIMFSRSVDNGFSWSNLQVLNPATDHDGKPDVLPTIAADGLGRWLVAWSTANAFNGNDTNDWDIAFSRSTDAGASWTNPLPLNASFETDNNPNHIGPIISTDRGGNWMAVWQVKDQNDPHFENDGRIYSALSIDDGQTWGDESVVFHNATANSGDVEFPKIVPDGFGKWIAAWDSRDTLGGTVGTDYDLHFATTEQAPQYTYADLSVGMTDSADPISTGSIFTYMFTVRNDGPLSATDTLLTCTLAAGMEVISGSHPVTIEPGNAAVMSLGNLLPATDLMVTLQVKPHEHGTLNSGCVIASNEFDAVIANNSDTEQTVVTGPLGPDFSAVFGPVTQRTTGRDPRLRYRVSSRLTITNSGNRDTTANSQVKLYLSPDPVNDVGMTPLRTVTLRKLRVGRTFRSNVNLNLTSPPTGKKLIAVIDPANTVAELDEGNNTVETAPLQ